jgi:hypothetical protein
MIPQQFVQALARAQVHVSNRPTFAASGAMPADGRRGARRCAMLGMSSGRSTWVDCDLSGEGTQQDDIPLPGYPNSRIMESMREWLLFLRKARRRTGVDDDFFANFC